MFLPTGNFTIETLSKEMQLLHGLLPNFTQLKRADFKEVKPPQAERQPAGRRNNPTKPSWEPTQ